MPRAVVLVLDSLGIGASADAGRFGDAGADTLGHIAAGYKRRLQLPNLSRLGLFHAHRASTGHPAEGVSLPDSVDGAWGYACEISTGKDTPSGHWEIAGVPVRFEWGYFTKPENSFPDELLESLVQRAELPGVLGNCHASGTEIVDRLGAEHVATGKPIVYTSADSVFQIAAHEQAFGLDRLYRVCLIARQLIEPWNIGRVIARPFIGDSECGFERTPNRVDYSLAPPAPTVMQKLEQAGGEVVAVGKIADIYAQQGITRTVKAAGNPALFDATLAEIHRAQPRTLIMTNFVDFDMLYGHRRDLEGYARALEYFDNRLPELYEILDKSDLLIITADHGCDPTWPGSDHTREHVPVLVRGGGLEPGPLGERHSFADIGQTLAAYFDLEPTTDGLSLLSTGRTAT